MTTEKESVTLTNGHRVLEFSILVNILGVVKKAKRLGDREQRIRAEWAGQIGRQNVQLIF